MHSSIRPGLVVALALALASMLQTIAVAEAQCQQVYTRKEFRDMTVTERTKWINALSKLFRTSTWQTFSQTHANNAIYGHNTAAFFPWHRQFMHNYQQALFKIDPTVVVPYWDSSLDSQAPASSVVWDYIGSSSGGGCVPDGPFSNYTLAFPNNACLKRDFNPNGQGMSTLTTSEAIGELVRTETDYASFESKVEYGMHAVVHNAIGGDMAYMYSPNDPVFYLHHGFVDKIWSDWQALHGQSSYDGTWNGNAVKVTDTLRPFGTTVQSVLDHKASLCYVYAQPSGGAASVTTSAPSTSATSTRSATSILVPSSTTSVVSASTTSMPVSSTAASSSATAAGASSTTSSSLPASGTSATSSTTAAATKTSTGLTSTASSVTSGKGSSSMSTMVPGSSSSTSTTTAAAVITSTGTATTATLTDAAISGTTATKTTQTSTPTPTAYSSQDFCDALQTLRSSHYAHGHSSSAGISYGTVTITVSGRVYNGTLTLPIPPAPLSDAFMKRMMYNASTIRSYEQEHLQIMADIAAAMRNGSYIAGPGMTNATNPGLPGSGTGTSAYGGLFKVYPPTNTSSVLSNYTSNAGSSYNFTTTDMGKSVSSLVSNGAVSTAVFGLSTVLALAAASFLLM